jgi:hypothetical protein
MIQRKTNKHNSLENFSVQIFADGADLEDLETLSLDTVRMFAKDAEAAGYSL